MGPNVQPGADRHTEQKASAIRNSPRHLFDSVFSAYDLHYTSFGYMSTDHCVKKDQNRKKDK